MATTTSSASSTNALGTLSAGGIGSGLDVNGIVSQLVEAEKSNASKAITRRQTQATTTISALAGVKSALGLFQSSLTPLLSKAVFTPRTANTSDDTIVKATAAATAVTGTYNVKVLSLASAHQLSSAAFPTGLSATVGTGTLTIAQGTQSFAVTIDSTHNTLAGVRDAINSAANNTGVQATIVTEQNGAHLVLSASKSGAANAIKVTQTGGDGGLQQLVYDPSTSTTNLTQLQPAADAHIKVANYDVYSTTNTVTGAIQDVTLQLVAADQNKTISVTIARDDSAANAQVQAFVDAYNRMNTSLSKLDNYDAASQTAGPLFGDSQLRGIEQQLNDEISQRVPGQPAGLDSLAAIGVTRQLDGSLALDADKLKKATDANPEAVATLFTQKDTGVGARFNSYLTSVLQSRGPIDSRNTSLQADLKDIQDDSDALDARMNALQASYMKQFSALDTLLASFQTTASYLTTALAGLPKPNSINSK